MAAVTFTRHTCDRCGATAEEPGLDAPHPDHWVGIHDPDDRWVAICGECKRSFRSWWQGHIGSAEVAP